MNHVFQNQRQKQRRGFKSKGGEVQKMVAGPIPGTIPEAKGFIQKEQGQP